MGSVDEFRVQRGNERRPGRKSSDGDGRGVEVVKRFGPWMTLTALSLLLDDHHSDFEELPLLLEDKERLVVCCCCARGDDNVRRQLFK